jgi:pyruvate/2-oxoglutarate dehydrogenase complex dihydrolipoamide dehydrogenase (E3) component
VAGGSERKVTGSHLLLAIGRTPNIDRLNLGAAGVQINERGWIEVDAFLKTSAEGVYAIGDVNGGPQFTHISYDDFRVLRTNLLDGGHRSTDARPVPYVLFTDPQLGRVGLGEVEARKKGIAHKKFTMPMDRVARALEVGESRGFVKVLVDPASKQILGAAVLGLEGGEVMNMLHIAMMGKVPYTALQEGIFAHPTLGEALNNLFG